MKPILIAVALLVGVIAPPTTAHAADGPSVTATITVGTAPWGVAFSPDGTLAYVGNSGSNTLSIINVAARTTTTVSGGVLNAAAPAGIAVKPDGSKVLVTAYAVQGTLGMTTSDLVLSEVNVGCANPLPISMASDGLTAYVGCGSGNIQAVDTATLVASNVRAEMGQIDDIAYVPKGSKSSDDIAYLLNVVSGTVAGYFRLSNGAGSTATLPGFGLSLAVDATGTRAYVGDSTGVLSVFEISNPTVPLHTISVGGELRGIALSADGARAYVTDKSGNRVKVVDLATRSVTHTVDVGTGPQRIAISPDGRTALVTNNGTNTVSLLTLIPEPALTPVFDTPTSTADGFTVNVTNYDAAYTWTPSVSAGSVLVGTVIGSTLPLTITGLTAGQSATLTMGTSRSGYAAGSATVNGAASPAPRPPSPGPPAPPAPGPRPQPSPTVSAQPTVQRPSAPRDIAVVVGDSRALLTWLPPLVGVPGSQMSYVVEANPGGEVCSTVKTTCIVEDLVNGTSYTFAVRGTNSAGTGPWSTVSAAVTPDSQKATEVVIRGHRKKVRGQPGLIVRGVSTGLPAGTVLRPWLRFQGSKKFIQGSARVRVDESGVFQWERRIRVGVRVVMREEDGNVRSNVISVRR